MTQTDDQRGTAAKPPQPGRGGLRPGAPSDGADPAANEASEPDGAGSDEYGEALREIGDQPRPQG